MIQAIVIREYHLELERAKLPGYASRYDDDYFDAPLQAASPPEAASPLQAASPPSVHPSQSDPPKPHFDDAERIASLSPQVAGEEGFGKGILDNESPQ